MPWDKLSKRDFSEIHPQKPLSGNPQKQEKAPVDEEKCNAAGEMKGLEALSSQVRGTL